MFDIIDLILRRAFLPLSILFLIVAVSATTESEIVNLSFIRRIQINNQPIADKTIAYIAYAISLILFLLFLIQRGRSFFHRSFDLAAQPLKGLYKTDLQYNAEIVCDWQNDLIVPHWKESEVRLPPKAGEEDQSYYEEIYRLLQRLDNLAALETPFYSKFEDLETSFELYIETDALSHSKDQFIISGFGVIRDRLRSSGDFCEAGLIVLTKNRERHHNIIDIRGFGRKWRLFSKGISVVIEFEELVHPMKRYEEFHIYLSLLLSRNIVRSEWVLSTGVYLVKNPENGTYYVIGYTDNFSVGQN